MKRSEIMDLLNAAEERFDVDQWLMNGVHIWPIFRLKLAFQLYEEYFSPQTETTQPSRMRQQLKIICNMLMESAKHAYAYCADYQHNAKLNKQYDAVFLSPTRGRSFPVDGKMYDIYCDPIIDQLYKRNMTSFVLEFGTNGRDIVGYRYPRYRNSMYIDLKLKYLLLHNLLFSTKEYPPFEQENEFNELCRFLHLSGLPIVPPSLRSIRDKSSQIRVIADYFRRLLVKITPAMGFVVCYYGTVGMAFCLACRELGMASVDIQHGVQGEFHAAYGRWNRLPEKGYEVMPSLFWCWSEYESQTIQKWSKAVSAWTRPTIGGNLYLNTFKQKNNDIVNYYDRRLLNMIGKQNYDIHILVSLSDISPCPSSKGFPEMLREAIATSPDSWFWWVRLHPSMVAGRGRYRKFLQNLRTNNINLDDATDLPLYSLLRFVDVNVTTFSSVVLEAEQFGVPSIIIEETGVETYQEQIASGWGVPAFTAAELLETIPVQAKKKNKKEVDITDKSGIDALDLVLSQAKRGPQKD